MKVGQVPFLPFISSSSVLLQLSVDPCQKERVGIKERREEEYMERKNGQRREKKKKEIARVRIKRLLDYKPLRIQMQPDGQMDGWTTPSQEHKPARTADSHTYKNRLCV